MANSKSSYSKEALAAQKRRTHVNLIRKYEKLIEESPLSPHVKAWSRNIESLKQPLK